MTLSQLQLMTEDELAMILYVVNNLSHPGIPPGPFVPENLVWFKHTLLIQKMIDVFQMIKPEYHSIYISLMEKMGVKIEINPIPSQPVELNSTPTSSNNPPTSSIS